MKLSAIISGELHASTTSQAGSWMEIALDGVVVGKGKLLDCDLIPWVDTPQL